MIPVTYPAPSFKIEKREGVECIFDTFRKKWIVLTPEEWVRQNFLQYLLQSLHYPASLIAVEKEIRLGELKKRFDILVYDRDHAPWLIVECKSMDVQLSESVLQQALRYSISVPASYIVITNGSHCMAWHRHEGELKPINELPLFTE
ncbi:MAG: type I restriction enzyme HsdR N-terminal domain-containing protein [Bacteroidetes bacterium]|nr:type I restriction enzyme HsdR N-terminal domain-containing protein [Bacteroidota bacterium]